MRSFMHCACGNRMSEKALFTSLYWYCDRCQTSVVTYKDVSAETGRFIQAWTAYFEAVRAASPDRYPVASGDSNAIEVRAKGRAARRAAVSNSDRPEYGTGLYHSWMYARGLVFQQYYPRQCTACDRDGMGMLLEDYRLGSC